MKEFLNNASVILIAAVAVASAPLYADYETVPPQPYYVPSNNLPPPAYPQPAPTTYAPNPAPSVPLDTGVPYRAQGSSYVPAQMPSSSVPYHAQGTGYVVPQGVPPAGSFEAPYQMRPTIIPTQTVNVIPGQPGPIQLPTSENPSPECPMPYMRPGSMMRMSCEPPCPPQGYPCYSRDCGPPTVPSYQVPEDYLLPPWVCYQNPLDAGVPFVTGKPRTENWSIYAALLYWRAFGEDLGSNCLPASVTESNVDVGPATTDVVSGTNRNLTFEWNTGFRVGFEFDSAYRGIDIGIFYTRLNSRAHLPKKLEPTQFARWNLNYNVLDVLLGYTFCITPCVTYTPVGGIRTVWIDQRLHSQITGTFTRDGAASSIIGTRNDSENFWGIGPELGIGAEWRWNGCFSLFGGIGGAILYGQFKTKFFDTEAIGDSTSETNDNHNFWTCQPVFDAELGLRWRFNVCGPMLYLDLAWEHHRYVNFNRIGRGDLSLDGLTFAAKLEF